MNKLVPLTSKAPTVQQFGDPEKMTKKELVKVVKDTLLPLTDPEKYKELVKSQLPELVRDLNSKEDMSTAMMQSMQEAMLVIVETLKKNHSFSDSEIQAFLKNVQGNVKVVKAIEEGGLSMLSDHSMKHIVNMVNETGIDQMLTKIAETRFDKESTWRTGMEHPNYLEGSKIERKLQKPIK
jgi:uncharacterized protein YPO0396